MAGRIIVQDEGKMLEVINSLPNQLEWSWTNYFLKSYNLDIKNFSNVIIAGMGGSGIAGRLMKDTILREATVPIEIWADYQTPGYLGEKTLVIAVSCSGNTEETLDTVRCALESKATVVGITTGGQLKELLEKEKQLCMSYEYKSQPRGALGYLYGLMVALFCRIGLCKLKEESFFQALKELQKVVKSGLFLDKAEEVALSLNNKVCLVAGHWPLGAVAKRWANQINENAKALAFYAESPEFCHNLINGLDNPISEKLIFLYLESKFAFSRSNARLKVLDIIIKEKHIPFIPFSVKSGSILSEQWLLIYFGDLLSYYLAGVYAVDPTPLDTVSKLKEGLSKL